MFGLTLFGTIHRSSTLFLKSFWTRMTRVSAWRAKLLLSRHTPMGNFAVRGSPDPARMPTAGLQFPIFRDRFRPEAILVISRHSLAGSGRGPNGPRGRDKSVSPLGVILLPVAQALLERLLLLDELLGQVIAELVEELLHPLEFFHPVVALDL